MKLYENDSKGLGFFFLGVFLFSSPQTQNTVFSAVNPLASSFTSSITSSLASSIGSDSSSPTTLSTMNAKATPFYPGSNTVESVIGTKPAVFDPSSCLVSRSLPSMFHVFFFFFSSSGSALDLNFSDINVASLEKELEEQDNNAALTSRDRTFLEAARFVWTRCPDLPVKYGTVTAGQRVLGGSAPVNIPGSLARSSSFNSSSSLSTSPLSSLSQSLSQSLLSGTISQQNPPSNMLAKQEHGLLGTPTSSSQTSLGKLIASGISLPKWAPKRLTSDCTRHVDTCHKKRLFTTRTAGPRP